MASVLPKGFVDVSTALTRRSGEVNVMGRVTDFQVPKPSRGTDWMSTFTLTDAMAAGSYDECIRVKYFKPLEREHPQIRSHGDIVLVRNLPIKEFNGAVGGLSTKTTSWTVFPVGSVPEKAPPNRLTIKNLRLPTTEEPKYSEMLYVIELCNSRDKSLDKSSGIPISSMDSSTLSASAIEKPTQGSVSSTKTGGRACTSGRDKFSLIKDLEIDKFYDIVGQVVKLYANNNRLEMYVTDYTTSNSLYKYEWDKEENNTFSSSMSKSKKWPGPYGKMTLMTTLWPPHSDFADGLIKPGHFVFMQNVHIKSDRDNRMEGAMHEDRYYRNKVLIRGLNDDDERVKNVLRRKREYTEKFKAQSETFVRDVRSLKDNGDQSKKPNTKTARKKRRLERQQQAALEKDQPLSKKQKKHHNAQKEEDQSPQSSPSAAQPPPPKPTTKSTRSDLNKNVHCTNHTIPITPLSTILSLDPSHMVTTPSGITHTLPFQNNKYRATLRVVDFFPADIADFALRSRKPSEFDALSDYEASDSDSESEHDLPPDSDDEASGKRKEKQRGGSVGRDRSEEDEESEEKKWEWRFALVLEDADEPKPAKGETRSRITVYIAQQDGDFLLKEDAVDLRASPSSLDTLREKLFLLWGDLEERKTAAAAAVQLHEARDHNNPTTKNNDDGPKSKPFQCCLQEYGIRAKKGERDEDGGGDAGTGWERRWRMFETTII